MGKLLHRLAPNISFKELGMSTHKVLLDANDKGIRGFAREMKRNGSLYLIVLPVIIFYFIFHYMPMYGVLMSFQDYSPRLGIGGSEWVGFKYYKMFFSSPDSARSIWNTLKISFCSIAFGFPAPIIFALLLNELKCMRFKKCVQTLSYLPHFISIVVICGMIRTFVDVEGIIGALYAKITGVNASMLMQKQTFLPIYVLSNIWQGMGWDSIVYLAALTAVDQELYEAADLDGAGRIRKIVSVTLPAISTTVVTMLILKLGHVMSVGYEKVILLYNPLIYDTADIVSSLVYRVGFEQQNWSYSSAIGLFNSVVNLALVIITNKISRKISDTGLW